VAKARTKPVAWALTMVIRAYQLVLSPLLGPRCRFYPSCSSYAVQALTTHGAVKGVWLAGRRLLHCHPWNPGGVDHVPPADQFAWFSRLPRSSTTARKTPQTTR
jgi:putative membrane protein insertion efficiency factor